MELTVEAVVFFIFSVITLGGALLVVSSRNLFHAGLYLMLSLFGIAGLFVLLSAPLLAGFQVVVYIGAIAILIILAIMLTPGVTQMKAIYNTQWTTAIAVAVIFFLILVAVLTPAMHKLGSDNWNAFFTQDYAAPVPPDSMAQFGRQLVDPDGFMLPFELASVLLMGAMIGAVLLVNPGQDEPDDTGPGEG